MKARNACAVFGIAVAVGAVVFMRSLVATNDRQAVARAEALLKAVPVEDGALTCSMAVDYRPNGRVMQGPPLMAVVATSEAAHLGPGECAVTTAFFAQRRLAPAPIGSELTLVGRKGAHRLRLAAVREQEVAIPPVRGYPNAFVSPETAAAIGEEWHAWEPKTAAELAPLLTSDAARNFDRAKALLLWAAALTGLCLLVNSLLLFISSRRKEIAILRMVGMTRAQLAQGVTALAFTLTVVGWLVGGIVACGALRLYVAADPVAYPMGMAVDGTGSLLVLAAALLVARIASLLALKSAFSVRPLEAASSGAPRRRHRLGMMLAFACGFGAFVAVEVWGASLMRAFVPSPEWPDAIVSILPGGVSSFDIAKLRGQLKGVSRIHELAPLQVDFDPPEALKVGRGGGRGEGGGRGGGRGGAFRNALLLGSDWLPDFRFVAGTREAAEQAIREGDNCIITDMMARARHLALGDDLKLDCGRGLKLALKVVGIVDLNWHMVTSRGLVRGLNRKPVNTDGPVFVSFDTVEACDARPAAMVKMTHLWLDYEPDFLAAHGPFEAGRLVEREIVAALGLLETEVAENAVRLHSRDEVADGTLAHGSDIIGSMARVPFVFIAVISLGFVAMLVASVEARAREFRVLRAVGATRGQLAAMLVREALGVAAKGIAFAVPGGALVGWLATAGTRAAMAQWGIPPCFAIPALTVAEGALGALAFALLVAVPVSLAIVGRDPPKISW